MSEGRWVRLGSCPSYASRNAPDKEGDEAIRAALKAVFAMESEVAVMEFDCDFAMSLLEKHLHPEKVPSEEEVRSFLWRKVGGHAVTLHNEELKETKEVVRHDSRYL